MLLDAILRGHLVSPTSNFWDHGTMLWDNYFKIIVTKLIKFLGIPHYIILVISILL